MIVISLQPARKNDRTVDPLAREYWGYYPGMTDLGLFNNNRGCWVIGEERAHREKYALFAVPDNGGHTIKVAVDIHSIDLVIRRSATDTRDHRRIINGRILTPGHPVYDHYVGKPSPVGSPRNPVGYIDSPFDNDPLCGCGCGKPAGGLPYIRGHEQTALHDRVRQIGTVAEFITWFDAMTKPFVHTSTAPATI